MSLATSTPPAACPRCQRILGELPAHARFCPKCGAGLPIPIATEIAKPSLRERMEQIQSLLHGPLAENAPSSIEQLHSLMLLGYANAMLQLGWRYEHGSGVAHNATEAERCYTKSAKLGNVFARGILGDHGIELSEKEAVPVQKIEEPPTLPPPLPS